MLPISKSEPKMPRNNSDSDERLSILRSPQERKEALRKIITGAESLRDTVGDNAIQTLELYMEETDNINSETGLQEKIHNQEEVLMDSEMMSISSKVLKQCTKSLTKLVCSYNHIEFAQKLVQYVKELSDVVADEPDWSLLETQVTKCFKRTPTYTTLLGTMVPLEKKEVNRKKPMAREAQAQIKRPKNIVAVEREEEGLEQTVKMKAFITRYYKTHSTPLDFFKLILHPADFGKTIENTLQVSFLVRDGKVRVMKDTSGILIIQPCTKNMSTQLKAGKTTNIQNLINLNMKQWKTLKDTYRLETPMIEFDDETV